MKLTNLIALTAAAASMAACTMTTNSNFIQPSDTIITRTEAVADFTSLDINGAINVRYTQTDSVYVRVSAPDNVMPYVKITVKGTELNAGVGGHDVTFRTNPNITLEIGSPSLSAIDLSGACTISIPSLATAKLDAELSGASSITCGMLKASAVDVEAMGASTASFDTILAENVDLDASGASTITASVDGSKTVKADASGASVITVSGSCAAADLEASGASHVHASELTAQRVSSDTSGASSISVKK